MLSQPNLLDIVIVNWNSGNYLRKCLDSIAGQTEELPLIHGITIVDNASDDGSQVIPDYPDLALNLVNNTENLGFGAACNQGAIEGEAPYLLFLNPDTQVCEGYLKQTLTFLETPQNRTFALVGVQMVDDEGQVSRTCAHFPSVKQMLLRSLGLDQLPWFQSKSYMMRTWDHTQSRQVDHVIGAFYLIRREAFESLGGFDKDFFVYLEDLDLSLRLNQSGKKCMYLATTSITHAQGGSSRNIKAQRLYYALSARLTYAKKHYKAHQRPVIAIGTLVLEPVIRLCQAAITGSKGEMKNILKAYLMLYRKLLTGEN